MRSQLTQSQGGTLRTATLMAIARSSNCKLSEVAYFNTGLAIDSIKFLYDKDSESIWVNEGTGTVVSWTLSDNIMTVLTNTGTFTLNKEVDGSTGSVKWIYNSGYAKGGETSITINADSALSVTEVYLNGGRQFEGQGYTVSGLTVTLASPLVQNDLLVIILGSETLDSADALQSILSGSGGAGTIGLKQKGNVQNAISYLTPEMFGAVGDGTTDDSTAIQNAVNYIKNNGGGELSFDGSKTYLVNSTINIGYVGSGVVSMKTIVVSGNGAKINVGVAGIYAFTISFDKASQQDDLFKIKDFWFYSTLSKTANGIYCLYNSWTAIENCQFRNLNYGIYSSYSLRNDTSKCSFWGCNYGIYTLHTRDTVFDTCHAYACTNGFYFEGTVDVSSDGNIQLVNSTANGCLTYGVVVKGQYTPKIINCTIEQTPTGLRVESSQYGQIDDLWIGPSSTLAIQFINTLNTTNDYWQVSNISCQSPISLQGLKYTSWDNLHLYLTSRSDVSGKVVTDGCNIIFTNVQCHGITGGDYYFYFTNSSNCNVFSGYSERSFYFDATSTGIVQDITFTSTYKVIYAGTQPTTALATFNKTNNGKIIPTVIKWNVEVPSRVLNATIAASGNTTLDMKTILPTPTDIGDSYTAEVVATFGNSGSVKTYILLATSNNTETKVVIANPDSGTALTVSGSVITIANSNSSATLPAQITLTRFNYVSIKSS